MFVPLDPNCFTTRSRTPWAGDEIFRRFKKGLGIADEYIGESWELSLDPAMPSRLRAAPEERLIDFLREHADGLVDQLQLGVKIINPSAWLSLQVHPSDIYGGLQRGECGKPECWYVINAAPGAGSYVGLSEDVTLGVLQKALERGDDAAIRALCRFVPMQAGDFFELPTGCIHALGPGVTVLEPQRVLPERTGVTYRLWDWGRRYDGRGMEHPSGQARPLHVTDALAVSEVKLRPQSRRKEGPQSEAGNIRLCGKTSYCSIWSLDWAGGGHFKLQLSDAAYAHVFVASGSLALDHGPAVDGSDVIQMRCGESGFWIAALNELLFVTSLGDEPVNLLLTAPPDATIQFQRG